jgi:cytochrome c-type biogenesis protein CcsB
MAPEALSALSDQLVYLAMAGYGLAVLLFAVEFAFEGGWAGAAGVLVAVAGLGANLGAALTRGLAVDRVPWGNMFEYSVMVSAVLVTGFLVWSTRRPEVRPLGSFFLVLALLALGAGRFALYAEAGPLVPALQSNWLRVHVLAAIIGSSLLGIASVFSLLYLVRERVEGRRPAPRPLVSGGARTADPDQIAGALSRYADPVATPAASGAAPTIASRRASLAARLPSAATLDGLAYKTTVFAFPIWTFAIIAGAIWAQSAWGRYWGWDPKETWSFITWVVYAAYLHARATAGWRARRAAWISVVGLVTTIINFYVINTVVVGLHSYSGLG